jgi:uncharacterized protein YndB with AHSA1/START domain
MQPGLWLGNQSVTDVGMKFFATETVIHAPAEKIWALLTDAAGWPSWNTTVDRVEGSIALGERIKVFVKLSPAARFP